MVIKKDDRALTYAKIDAKRRMLKNLPKASKQETKIASKAKPTDGVSN